MKKEIISDSPLMDIHPKEWAKYIDLSDTTVHEYRNLQHFKNHVSTLKQRNDDNCDIPYADALKQLLKGDATMTQGDYELIKNKVKENLLKRGLISDTVYESYKYDVQGDIWDVAKVVAEDPMCCLVPNETYNNHFYELYVSVSYHYGISNEEVTQNMAKILATVELLEQEHYYCKLTLVFPDNNCNNGSGKSNYMALIPLFSHKDVKTIETMSSVLNDRLLRKFFFAVIEDLYGDDLAGGYGSPVNLPNAIVPVNLNEVALAQDIVNKVITPCEMR